jgi:hypothetical protein
MSDDCITTNNVGKPEVKLSELINIESTDAYFTVYAKATYFRDQIRVFKPNTPYNKLLPGLKPIEKAKGRSRNQGTVSPEDSERSIRRSKKMVRDYCQYNKFEILATFTFKSERQNILRCMAKMNTWLKNQQKRSGSFDYLIVAEFHKDGQSVHFHALFKGFKGKLTEAIHPRTGQSLKKYGRQVYNFAGYRHGFAEAQLIKDEPESHAKVGNYVGKYITKDMTPALFGKHRYWRSSGVIPPETEDNPAWLKDAKSSKVTVCEYGVIFEFPISVRTQGA